MPGLIPFNARSHFIPFGKVFDGYGNMLDDFFSGNMSSRNLICDTFKIDIVDTETGYLIEAELPGVKKDELELNIDDEGLCISVNRSEEVNNDSRNYIHRERCVTAMSRRVRLAGAKLSDIKAKIDDGVLTITIPKEELVSSPRKINID